MRAVVILGARAAMSARAGAFVMVVAFTAGCSRPLPEEGTAAATLYQARCGACHGPYQPSATKFSTWEMIVPRMERFMASARQPPLTADERQTLLDYLRRNS